MHVAFLSHEYPPLPGGGIGTSVRNLARALVAAGHRVTVVGWGPEARFDDRGVAVRFLGHARLPKLGWWLNRRRAARYLGRLCREEGLAIVEAHDWCAPSAGMRLPCPLVVRLHGSATYFGHILDEPVRWRVRRAEAVALHRADALLSVSRFTAELTRRLFDLGERPIEVIPNGVELEQFAAADPAAVEPDTLLYVGTVVRKKGVIDLCRAFSLLLATRPRARLLVVGRDVPDVKSGAPSTWDLCRRALSEAARERVSYLGPRPYDEVQAHLRKAAVCVFPSYAEALPLSWMEAMACARPVIAYDVGWAGEMIRDGRDGRLVGAGDVAALAAAAAELLAAPEEAHRLGRAARATVEARFAAPVVAAAGERFYRRVIAGRRRGGR
ncbi:MAG: glycosyltransferase family 1 protein [Acidobacteria bacterium]|nr:MAG: glycosyltransferase family 1 protein [Acidobacteriota bacterium]